jgi:hypothetical protein
MKVFGKLRHLSLYFIASELTSFTDGLLTRVSQLVYTAVGPDREHLYNSKAHVKLFLCSDTSEQAYMSNRVDKCGSKRAT